MADNNTDVSKMPFERAIEELETIVKRLEEGKVPLEESVAIYERGEALKRRCEELLRQAARVVALHIDDMAVLNAHRTCDPRDGLKAPMGPWPSSSFPRFSTKTADFGQTNGSAHTHFTTQSGL